MLFVISLSGKSILPFSICLFVFNNDFYTGGSRTQLERNDSIWFKHSTLLLVLFESLSSITSIHTNLSFLVGTTFSLSEQWIPPSSFYPSSCLFTTITAKQTNQDSNSGWKSRSSRPSIATNVPYDVPAQFQQLQIVLRVQTTARSQILSTC